jgi:hypothetical protein
MAAEIVALAVVVAQHHHQDHLVVAVVAVAVEDLLYPRLQSETYNQVQPRQVEQAYLVVWVLAAVYSAVFNLIT